MTTLKTTSTPQNNPNINQHTPVQTKVEAGAANDPLEQEADAVADQVTGNSVQMMPDDEESKVQLMTEKSSTVQMIAEDEEKIQMMSKGLVQPKEGGNEQGYASPTLDQQLHQPNNGQTLPSSTQYEMGQKMGADFSQVKVHTDSKAVQMNQELGAKAFTHGNNIYFNEGNYNPTSKAGKHLLAHELTHTVQQGAAVPFKIQRYGTGEHTQFGAVDNMLVADHQPYIVQPGEGLIVIARKFGVDVAELRELNKDKLHEFDFDGRKEIGFYKYEEILIPSNNVRVDPAAAASSAPQEVITIQGVDFTYGELIAIADFFGTPDDLYTASPSDLRTMKDLLVREASAPGSVTTDEWQAATGGRYLDLATANDAHFAPQNASLTPTSTAGTTSDNHKDMWERYHREAIDLMIAGDRDRALATNAFGDHFLTDAFAAGHLVNKQDVMALAEGSIPGNEDAVFEGIAAIAWSNPGLVALCSQYESTAWHGRNIETEGVFASLLEGIYEDATTGRPLIMNAYAKATHDELNARMVEVENAVGDSWTLSGDDSLNADSLEIGKKAVAQSKANVLNAANSNASPNYAALYTSVWQYVPYPTAAGEAFVQDRVNNMAVATQPESINAMAALIISEIQTIIDGLVAEGHLQLID